jgi:hypothetical protein
MFSVIQVLRRALDAPPLHSGDGWSATMIFQGGSAYTSGMTHSIGMLRLAKVNSLPSGTRHRKIIGVLITFH